MSSYVSIRVEGGSEEARERGLALGVAAGALGAEERDGPPPSLILFAKEEQGPEVETALRAALGAELRVGAPVPMADVAWSEAWKEGLEPIVVSARLAITPSFVPFEASPGQLALVIDPGQAFGTGGHASTRLALDLLDALPEAAFAGRRVLDVGCGTGVLALAALGLGAKQAVALDLDPLATEATWENAVRNHLTTGLRVWTGPIEGLDEGPFDLVLANMIWAELFPLLGAVRGCCCAGGRVVLSGVLEEERALAEEALAAVGLEIVESRSHQDELGDHWLALSCITITG
ncbi:MAG: 50S ribosomal protein L11 methyltransferase [Deltaproteobacteria bacterium]|nr:50S ribosomal protein L11 methyltransferase [Deltaproteobacteria bacterium]